MSLYSIKIPIDIDYFLWMKTIDEAEEEFLRLVGQRIRDYRKERGLSQERLAELASVHPTYISHLENGTNASINVYRRVAAALRVSLVQLLDVNQKRTAPDALMKVFFEVKGLGEKEQKLIMETIRGLLAGMKE
jgi:XRE family transcriptional regulator, regulator of sulfur utilization